MTGFQLMEFLVKQPAEILRSDVFAGLNDEDMIVDAFVAQNDFISLETDYQRKMDAAEEDERMKFDAEEYWRVKREEERRDELIQEGRSR